MSTGNGFGKKFLKPVVVSIRLSTSLRRLGLDCEIDDETLDYCTNRVKSEGAAFLTKTLPQLSKAVVSSLEIGKFQRPTNFQWSKGSLRYFRSLLSGIFDDQGWVLPTVDPSSLKKIRQFCEYFYKLASSFSPKELEEAAEKYLAHEKSLEIAEKSLDSKWAEKLRKNFETFYPYIANLHAHNIFESNRPRYTPGAFAGSGAVSRVGFIADNRVHIPRSWWEFKHLPFAPGNPTIYRELSPYAGFFREYPGCRRRIFEKPRRHDLSASKQIRGNAETTSEVLFVPKDSRGPRVISKEPLNSLRAQMSYFDTVSDALEKGTNFRINFKDQAVNQQLAREGSISKKWATLDLKDASDSVLYQLVKVIFRNSPGLRKVIQLTRSTHTRLGNKIIKLRKLAGMGSGLTFPTMALVIHLSVCTYVALKTGLPYSEVSKMVYVYGDDLIVPREWVDHAVKGLTLTQLRVNTDKSFSRGFFKESCGADFYQGEDVGIVRLRLSAADIPTVREISSRRTKLCLRGHGILQLERHCRELMSNGLYSVASYYYDCIEAWYGRKLPYVSRNASALGFYDPEVNPDSKEEFGFLPVPVSEDISDRQCPYKYLGTYLSAYPVSSLEAMFDTEPVKRFGEISQPRKVKLQWRKIGFAQKTALIDVL